MDIKLIPIQTKLDLAVFLIGDNFTMRVDHVIIATDFVACDDILGIHYDAFGYIKIDKDEARSKFSKSGKKLQILSIDYGINA